MSNPNSLDELFQRPLALPDNDAMTAEIMHRVAHVERQRKALLLGSGLAGTSVAAGIVLWANVLPSISSEVLPSLGAYIGRVGAEISYLAGLEPLSGTVGLWALAAASLIAMGLTAARFIHEP